MKQFNLTETEASELREFYILELERTKRKMAHIQSILSKFSDDAFPEKGKRGRPKKNKYDAIAEGISDTQLIDRKANKSLKHYRDEETTETLIPKRKGRPKKVLSAEEIKNKAKKERAKKNKKAKKDKKSGTPQMGGAKWTRFIMNKITGSGKPFTAKAMHEEAIVEMNIAPEFYRKSTMSIAACMSNMARKTGKLKTYAAEGLKNQFYGLPEWFEENGDLKQEYIAKLSKD